MSAERLRDAAKVLRERAESAAPAPWEWEPPSGESWPMGDESLLDATGETVLYGWGYDASGIHATDADRTYIAMMHPGVGAEAADLLALLADLWEAIDTEGLTGTGADLLLLHATRIADLILGGSE